MGSIGIMGGSFDPLHFGHIQLAISLYELNNLDEVWWIPAKCNPLKTMLPASDVHRLKMLQLGLAEIPDFKILDIELIRPTASYTIDTLRALIKIYPEHQFHLLLGDDSLTDFMKWKEPLEILRIAAPLIGARHLNQVPKEFEKGWNPIPVLDISSTNVRERIQNRQFCGHLVPAKVLDYIAQHRLYLSL